VDNTGLIVKWRDEGDSNLYGIISKWWDTAKRRRFEYEEH
jgi:hypothetical protein